MYENQLNIITEQMNELIAAGMDKSRPGSERVGLLKGSIKILQGLDCVCDAVGIALPDEAVSANVELDEHFNCNTAKKVANILERMSVSDSGMGRLEGVTVLSAPTLPKEIQIMRGIDPMLKQGKK